MPLVIDPAGIEIEALRRAAQWKGRRVLEIGAGDGRLTLRLVRFGPRAIEAIDPEPGRVRQARKSLPARYAGRIPYHAGQAENLKYKPESFDTVIFSWAL